jgi:hypothetical protein
MSDNLPGKGFFGWFGRQVGYVKKAVRASPAALPKPNDHPPAPPPPAEKVYENRKVEEAPHPENPHITLRRTIIDEAIVEPETGPREADRDGGEAPRG